MDRQMASTSVNACGARAVSGARGERAAFVERGASQRCPGQAPSGHKTTLRRSDMDGLSSSSLHKGRSAVPGTQSSKAGGRCRPAVVSAFGAQHGNTQVLAEQG